MSLEISERYNFYKLENDIKKGKEHFIKTLDNHLENNGIDKTLCLLKSSGICVNIFNNKKRKKLLDQAISHITSKINELELEKVHVLKQEINYFEHVFKLFNIQKENYFTQYEEIKNEHKVISYLIALELRLKAINQGTHQELRKKNSSKKDYSEDIGMAISLFESTCESTGMILKYFMYKNIPFNGVKRNISPKTIEPSSMHFEFNATWTLLNDILEYWTYSDVEVSNSSNEKVSFIIRNENFELNNLISNERFNNLREGWQLNLLKEVQTQQSYFNKNSQEFNQFFNEGKSDLIKSFSKLYFGSLSLNEQVDHLELREWIYAYELLIQECNVFIQKKQNFKPLNLSKACLSKSIYDWEKLFTKNGFTKEKAKIIIKMFTFDETSSDLFDTPFVKMDDHLVIVPSLTAQADISRALASNFLNRNKNLDFKGPGFEERIKTKLNSHNVKNSSLYKKVGLEEYQCDIAFLLDNELFLVECKAYVQPETTRQHANHLHKIYEDTLQLKRIADFYESNISIVNTKLEMPINFAPQKTHRILMTSSMIGTPLFLNGAYVIDESAFTMFLNRRPPILTHFEKDSYFSKPSEKFEIYKGDLSADKLIELLTSLPQVQIVKDIYKKEDINSNLFDLRRNMKMVKTLNVGFDIGEPERLLLNKYY